MNHLVRLEQFFNESFDSKPCDIKWVDKGEILRGLFQVDDNIFQIICKNKSDNIWSYDFLIYEAKDNTFSPDLTHSGKKMFSILKTVELGMQYFFNLKKPISIVFGASDESKGRKSIYEAFCQKFSKNNNLRYLTKIYNEDNIDRQIFILYDENIDKDLLTDVAISILVDGKFNDPRIYI